MNPSFTEKELTLTIRPRTSSPDASASSLSASPSRYVSIEIPGATGYTFLVPSDRLKLTQAFSARSAVPAWLVTVFRLKRFSSSDEDAPHPKTLARIVKCGLQALVEMEDETWFNATPLFALIAASWLAQGFKLGALQGVLRDRVEELTRTHTASAHIFEVFISDRRKFKEDTLRFVEEYAATHAEIKNLILGMRVELQEYELSVNENALRAGGGKRAVVGCCCVG